MKRTKRELRTAEIFAGGDGWLYSFEAKSGKLLWKFDCNPKKATPYKPGGGGQKCFIIATPVVHDNRCYIAVGQEPENASAPQDPVDTEGRVHGNQA